jgi:general secretion pathway protein K
VRPRSFSRKREPGIALITAVAIVAMASIAAVAMTQTLQFGIHRTGNILLADQRYLYSLGGEAWARGQLIRDLDNGQPYDSLNEDWAQELPLTVVEAGQVASKTSDLQGRFNLNNLYLESNADEKTQEKVKQQLALFQRLLLLLELEESIAQAVADWIDQDINLQFPDGAEDNDYLGLTPAYRTGNTLMADPSELRLVKGVNPEAFQKLRPFVSTLPEFTPINVNTAPKEVLRALDAGLDEPTVDELLTVREESPFQNKQAFLDRLKGLSDDNKVNIENIEAMISVDSHYFLSETLVQMDSTHLALRSMLMKSTAGVYTLSRTQGAF